MVTEAAITIIIPVRNAGNFAKRQIKALAEQTVVPSVIVLDSESADGSADAYEAAGHRVVPVILSKFDHGATRNVAMTLCDTEFLLYLTQDAIPTDRHAIARLFAWFTDPAVGMVFGRQLPRPEAGAIERHARFFNYPDTSVERTWPSAKRLGIKAVFASNAFAGYRRRMLSEIGGFPEPVIMGEDQVAAARALLANWTTVYAGDAVVEHSHRYPLLAELQRYFDNGVSHGQNRDLFKCFETATGEGRRFVTSELRYLLHHAPVRIPEAFLRSALKLAGYKMGLHEAILPAPVKRRLAMHPAFFSLALHSEHIASETAARFHASHR